MYLSCPSVKECEDRVHYLIVILFTHDTLSNLAPVRQNLFIHTLKGSSQAVILVARSGTNKCLSSSSVRVHTRAAMRPPALVPVTTLGNSPASKKAFIMPK